MLTDMFITVLQVKKIDFEYRPVELKPNGEQVILVLNSDNTMIDILHNSCASRAKRPNRICLTSDIYEFCVRRSMRALTN